MSGTAMANHAMSLAGLASPVRRNPIARPTNTKTISNGRESWPIWGLTSTSVCIAAFLSTGHPATVSKATAVYNLMLIGRFYYFLLYGLVLFLRSTRQVTMTAAGREFVAMAERVLNDLELSMRSLHEIADRRRGQVIVSSLIPVGISEVVAE